MLSPTWQSLITELVPREKLAADFGATDIVGGVGVARITLHTAVSSQDAGEAPLPERFEMPPATARATKATRAAGGRVVAVGTTAARAVESAVEEVSGAEPTAVPRSGWTDRLISVAEPPRLVDGLISGWA
jgi:S-adenosylmethionine:tRNA ribosyltransferase-isomerase